MYAFQLAYFQYYLYNTCKIIYLLYLYTVLLLSVIYSHLHSILPRLTLDVFALNFNNRVINHDLLQYFAYNFAHELILSDWKGSPQAM